MVPGQSVSGLSGRPLLDVGVTIRPTPSGSGGAVKGGSPFERRAVQWHPHLPASTGTPLRAASVINATPSPLTSRTATVSEELNPIALDNKKRLESVLRELPKEFFKTVRHSIGSEIGNAIAGHPDAQKRALTKAEIQGIAHNLKVQLLAATNSATNTVAALAMMRSEAPPLETGKPWLAGAKAFIQGNQPALVKSFDSVTHILSQSYTLLNEAAMSREDAALHLEIVDGKLKQIEAELAKLDQTEKPDDESVQGLLDEQPLDWDGLSKSLHEDGSKTKASLVKAMRDDLEQMKATLIEHKMYSSAYLEMDPLSVTQVEKNDKLWINAGLRALTETIAKKNDELVATKEPGKKTAINDQISRLESVKAAFETNVNAKAAEKRAKQSRNKTSDTAQDRSRIPSLAGMDMTKTNAVEKAIKKYVNAVPKQVEKQLEAAGIKGKLGAAHLKELNASGWDPIKRQFLTTDRVGKVQTATSDITPASSMEANKYFLVEYKKGEGRGSGTIEESIHAVNLAESKLTFGGKLLFQGLRHAVHCAFGIKNDAKRAEANLNRANETIIAALVQSGQMTDALKGKEPPILCLTSISLMTPDNILQGKRDEKKFVREQLALWNKLEKGDKGVHTLKIRVGKEIKEVRIKLDVAACNFGVNEGAFHRMAGFFRLSGWRNVRDPNAVALDRVATRAAAYTGPNKALVTQLASQIADIRADKSYQKMGNEPYKMVSRLALISHLMGNTPLYNCKSGKDRTGRLDAEIKFLAISLAQSGEVPEPDAILTRQQQALLRHCLFETGNYEMQEKNTGVPGFKAKNVKANEDRVGEKKFETFGLSKTTHS